MINKKNKLGKAPLDLGVKDAIHIAIASVRAGSYLNPGDPVKINEFGEGVKSSKKDSVGVVDPFLKGGIQRGQNFWILLSQTEIPNVQHVWEHPECSFEPPTRESVYNKWIQGIADDLGISYQELMDAARNFINSDEQDKLKINKTQEEIEEIESDGYYDFWSEWVEETGYDGFENYGSDCCPEFNYPEGLPVEPQ